MSKKVVVVGSGPMAEEYIKVIKALGQEAVIVGRNKDKALLLSNKYSCGGFGGGIEANTGLLDKDVELVIIACGVESLSDAACCLLKAGAKNILIEKPGALDLKGLLAIKSHMTNDVCLKVAYNRRFYS